MADNSIQGGTDTIRDIDKSGVKTQVFVLDLGGAGLESLLSSANPMPITLAAIFQKNTASTVTDKGVLLLAQRRDSDTAETTGDGQYTALKQDEAGRLKVATQPASNPAVSGNITANGQNVSIVCGRFGNLSISMVATSLVGHNVSFECSNNSTNGTDGNWYGVQGVRSNANTIETASGVLTATPAYMWHVNVGDYSYFRVRATAHTSGTAAYILKPGSYATEPIPASQASTTQAVSGTLTSAGTTTNTPATPTTTNAILSSAATTNGTVAKASAGTIYSVTASNTGAAAAYVKLHNSTTVTVGTTAVALTIPVPAGGTVNLPFGSQGMRYGTGICYSITNLAVDTDTTAVTAGQVKVNLAYI